ncbi:MAG: peroxiredoxin [Rubrobacter sp.]|nr:peroxiredoxin [Rubrobacter sp.]
MAKTQNTNDLPQDPPIPEDDGAADHLPGTTLPSVPLAGTSGERVDISELSGISVAYCYPMTGRPDMELPEGWDDIPGARGCTPQSCAFRDHHQELESLGARVLGISTQGTEYQREAAERLHLPYELLGDGELAFAKALNLPTFEADGMTLIKRLTLVIVDGRILKVFYPVFPPDANAAEVAAWLRGEGPGKD